MIVGIVGADEIKWKSSNAIHTAKIAIRGILRYWQDIHGEHLIMCSGGCPKGGVDIWAENIANEIGIETRILRPTVHAWPGKGGFRERNLMIANSDILYVVSPSREGKRVWNGGIWTGKEAQKLGKSVVYLDFEENPKWSNLGH